VRYSEVKCSWKHELKYTALLACRKSFFYALLATKLEKSSQNTHVDLGKMLQKGHFINIFHMKETAQILHSIPVDELTGAFSNMFSYSFACTEIMSLIKCRQSFQGISNGFSNFATKIKSECIIQIRKKESGLSFSKEAFVGFYAAFLPIHVRLMRINLGVGSLNEFRERPSAKMKKIQLLNLSRMESC
jgi:hypothetical protein